MIIGKPTVLILALAAVPLVAQEPPRPRPAPRAEPPRPVQPALQAVELSLPHALAAVEMTLPHALAAVELSLPHALAAVHASLPHALAAVEMTLPHALAAVELSLPHALAEVELALGALEHVGFDLEADDFGDFDATAPEPWAAQDPADALYRSARQALNDEDYAAAAQLFSRIHDEARFRGSEYRAVSFYYEALARTRLGGRAELAKARAALEEMRSAHAAAWKEQRDAAGLLARIDSELARMGDARSARAVQEGAHRSGCSDTKAEALNALLQMDAASAMPILEEVMKNKAADECSVDMRRRAVFLISQKRSDRTADILLDAAKNDPDPRVQEQAVFFLSQVNSEKAVEAIETILKGDPSRKLQEQAIFALSQHRSERAGALLRDYALRADLSPELRGNAIFWLSQHRGAENAQFLRDIYPRLDHREVKDKVIFAMSQLRGEASADWLMARALDQNEDLELRKNALFWAAQQRAIPIAKLNELYDKMPSSEMKAQLVFVLSQRARDPEAVDLLIKIARDEKDPELRKNAIFWLGQSKDPRAAKFLLELIKS